MAIFGRRHSHNNWRIQTDLIFFSHPVVSLHPGQTKEKRTEAIFSSQIIVVKYSKRLKQFLHPLNSQLSVSNVLQRLPDQTFVHWCYCGNIYHHKVFAHPKPFFKVVHVASLEGNSWAIPNLLPRLFSQYINRIGEIPDMEWEKVACVHPERNCG